MERRRRRLDAGARPQTGRFELGIGFSLSRVLFDGASLHLTIV